MVGHLYAKRWLRHDAPMFKWILPALHRSATALPSAAAGFIALRRDESAGSGSRTEHSATRWRVQLVSALLLALAVASAYAPAGRGVLLWDDEYVVAQNLFIRDWHNLPDLLTRHYFDRAERGHYTRSGEQSYRPLVTLSHFLDAALWDRWGGGYHWMNLLYHWLACLLLAWMLAALEIGPVAALGAALLLALHPLSSEAVLMVSYREDLLATAGVCAALGLHLRRRTGWAALALVAALLAKESAVVFLPLVMLGDWLRTSPGQRHPPSAWRSWLLYAVITLLYLWLLLFGLTDPAGGGGGYPGGSIGAGLADAARILLHDLRLLVWPWPLRFDPPWTPSSGWTDWRAAAALLVAASLVTAAWRRLPPWPERFLALWFFIAVLPVVGIYPLPNPVAERYLYLPLAGVSGLLALTGTRIWQRLRSAPSTHPAAHALAITALLLLIALTAIDRARCTVVSSESAFYNEMVRANPQSSKGYLGLGSALLAAGDAAGAVTAWEDAATLDPSSAAILHNLALAYLQEGRRQDAYDALDRALQRNPAFVESLYQKGMMLRTDGDQEGAEREIRAALDYNPNFIPAQFQLAYLLSRRGATDPAIRLYEEIVATDPRYAKAWKNLGILLLAPDRDPQRAATALENYLQLVPNDPQRDLIEKAIHQGRGQ
jgi:tetratricopeptide (TPR) repeat protein